MVEKSTFPTTAEIVIIGAGVIGLSIAFQLAERGARDIVVIERDEIASGATSKATGGIRQQFSSENDVKLSLESVRFFEQFEERVGLPFLFRQIGYLFLISDEGQMDALRRSAAMQNRLGVPTELLTPDEVQARHPQIDPTGLVGATFCATDGSAAPADAAYAFAKRARDLGVRILEGVTVTGIEQQNGRVRAVQTSQGAISTPILINAAGPWASQIGEMAGITLPVKAHPRQAFTVTPVEGLGPDFPFMIDMASGVYVHQEPGSIVLGGGDRNREAGWEPILDWSLFPSVVAAAVERVPVLEAAQSISGWCGLREMTPDDHAILGPVSELEGFWNAVGFSGHGFMHAPAVGRIISEWLLGEVSGDINLAAFSLERFKSAEVSAERMVF